MEMRKIIPWYCAVIGSLLLVRTTRQQVLIAHAMAPCLHSACAFAIAPHFYILLVATNLPFCGWQESFHQGPAGIEGGCSLSSFPEIDGTLYELYDLA